jgi:hypothetical protein
MAAIPLRSRKRQPGLGQRVSLAESALSYALRRSHLERKIANGGPSPGRRGEWNGINRRWRVRNSDDRRSSPGAA